MEAKRVKTRAPQVATIGFGFASHLLLIGWESDVNLANESQSVVTTQYQSKREFIIFEPQLKTTLFSILILVMTSSILFVNILIKQWEIQLTYASRFRRVESNSSPEKLVKLTVNETKTTKRTTTTKKNTILLHETVNGLKVEPGADFDPHP